MTPENWQKVKNILEKVLEISPSSRQAYLSEACGDDAQLRREIDSLLDFDRTGADFLEQTAFSAVISNGFGDKAKSFIGRQIGHYQIIEELGAGGMGAVFLARRIDGAFEHQVALKLIKRGMNSEAILRRFFNERQILASLKHPNIAHLIDGGTTGDGLPYFVMEYVEGEPINDYADRKNLDLEERLGLFRQICTAVSFAHQNLVIHRDLKPSNILVTKDGNIKLLDFGIAKLLKAEAADDAATTAAQMRIFTPEYASPEQIKGEKLTTATDVYSLGVILYELLTGNRPYKTDSKSISEIIKAVCETEPVRPSAMVDSKFKVQKPKSENRTSSDNGKTTAEQKQDTNLPTAAPNPKSLRGDLDNIILKALRKEPERRYSSVEQFGEDIRRYLVGLPVAASRDTLSYRAAKFVRRNRAAVAFSALVIVALIGGIFGTTWQAVRAERMRAAAEIERERAERRSENLRKISNSLVSEIERAIRDLPGSLSVRKVLLTRAVEQLDALAAESDSNTALQLDLVWAYQNLGSLPDMTINESDEIFRKALVLTENLLSSRQTDPAARHRLAMLYLDMIYNSRLRGDVAFTLEYNRQAVSIVEEILGEEPDNPTFQEGFWTANYHYALTMLQLGRASEAIETGRKILPVAEHLYRTEQPGTNKYDFIKPHSTRGAIGSGFSHTGDYQAAIKEFQTALDEILTEQVKRPAEPLLRRNEANMRLRLAAAYESLGERKKVFQEAQKALSLHEKLSADNPEDFEFQQNVADAELVFGQISARQKELQKAASHFRRALDLYKKITAADAEHLQSKINAARAQAGLGNVLVLVGKTSEGINYLREAVQFFEKTGAAKTLDVHVKRSFAETQKWMGEALIKTADKDKNRQLYDEAGEMLRRSLSLWQELQRDGVIKQSDAAQPDAVLRQLSVLENMTTKPGN